jgi:Na+/melibiose symporter-like transporter
MLRELGNIITWISIILLGAGYVWSFIIAWRSNKGLFFLVLLFWIVGYPILLAKYWKQTKNNFFVILAGMACFGLAFAILAATNPNRVNTSYLEQHHGYTQQITQHGRA